MKIPFEAFKIAVELINKQLAPQQEEPADLPVDTLNQDVPGQSALRFFNVNDSTTAKEPAPKVVTVSGSQGTQK